MEPITVVIPVGPDPVYLEWLPECIDSVLSQTKPPGEILIINDSAHGFHLLNRYMYININELFEFKYSDEFKWLGSESVTGKETWSWQSNKEAPETYISYWVSPWNVGVADAFNFGVSMAMHPLVFMLGSDDKMLPTCLEECIKAYDKHKIEGWYNVTIETSSGEQMWIPNNTAMVTKELWKWTGGFGPSAFAGPDAWLLSILMKHAPERIIQVQQGTPLCWLREHDHQDTKKTAWVFGDEMVSIRNKETERWKPHGSNS